MRIFGETVRYLRNTPQNDPSSGGSIIIHIEAQGSGSQAKYFGNSFIFETTQIIVLNPFYKPASVHKSLNIGIVQNYKYERKNICKLLSS